MKRIGIFLGVHPYAGGMFQYAQSLLDACKTLPAEGYAVEVAYIGKSWDRVLLEYPFDGRQIRAGSLGLFLANLFMAMRLPGSLARMLSSICSPISFHLRKSGCDLWVFPAQDAVGYQLRVPALYAIHDLMHRYEPNFPEVAKGGRYRIREHRFWNLSWYAKGILVDSNIGKDHVAGAYGVDREKIYVLPYIARRSEGRQMSDEEFNAQYRLPKKFLFYPAQFWAHKNHAKLLRAFASLKSEYQDLHLVFTGALRREYSNLIVLVEDLGIVDSVTFCGYVPDSDLPSFYKRARAMIMPTFFGPTNIPPLEAMIYSCPMAVSGIYGMPEQLGDAALYFDPHSEKSIAEAIIALWNDDDICQALKASCVNRMASWNEKAFAFRLREILSKLINDEASA